MGGRCRPQFLAEQTAQQGNQGNADQGDTTASHELLHTLTLCGGVIAAVTLHQVDGTPHAQTGPNATTRVFRTSTALLKNSIEKSPLFLNSDPAHT